MTYSIYNTPDSPTSPKLKTWGLCLFMLGYLWNYSLVFGQKDTTNYILATEIISDSAIRRFHTKIDKIHFRKDSLGTFGVSGLSADALLRQTQGLYVRNYGGHGGIKTVSFRGFAAQQTTASIMDIPYQSPQSSMVNFGNFYLDGFDAIDITHNPAAATQNALGGNINFGILEQKKSMRVQVGLGSFGENILGINGNLSHKKLSNRFAYQRISANDNYPFSINGETGKRENAGFVSQQYQGFLSYKFGKMEASYFLTGYKNTQGIPEPIVTGKPSFSQDSLRQKDFFHFFRLQFVPKNYKSLFFPIKTIFSLSQHYNLMESKALGTNYYYDNDDILAQLQLHHLLPNQSFITTIQYNYTTLKGDNLAINFRPIQEVQRKLVNLSLQHASVLGKQAEEKYRFHTTTAIRANVTQEYATLWNGSIGLTKRLAFLEKKGGKNVSETTFFMHGNLGNRLPSFNELYYFGYGNANLQPENVRAWDIGFQIQKRIFCPISAKVLFFQNWTKDKIIAVPISPVRWSTQAIGQAQTQGIEYALEAQITKNQQFYFNYTYQKAIDATHPEKPLLPYTPIEVVNYGYKCYGKNFVVYLNGNYTGWRFSALQNSQTNLLAAYQILDIGSSYRWKFAKFSYKIGADIMNIFDTNYAVIQSYPMPRRTFQLRVDLGF